MPLPPDLLAAYQKSLYWIRTSPNILLRVDTISEEARKLLEENDAESAAILTSDNPFSEIRSAEENAYYRDQLQQDVIQSQYPFFLTVSVDPTNQWPDEHGFLVIDLPLRETHRLLQKFDQWAAVWVEKNGNVTLLPRPVESDPSPTRISARLVTRNYYQTLRTSKLFNSRNLTV